MKKGDNFSCSFEVNENIYNGFIQIFGDKNPLHTDKKFAQKKGFADKVMHGNILNGFLSYFIGECLPDKNIIIHTQEIKYIKPVYINDKLLFSAEILDVFKSVQLIEFKFDFKNQDNIKVAKGKFQIGIIE